MSSRIATISMMRNESDIIEAFARYHLQFVDGMLFIDHRSNDNSCQIVESLSKEGLPISLVKTNDLAYNQSRLINAYAYRTAKKYRADWIIPLDLDECLHAPNLESPIQELTKYKGNKPVRIPWRTYVPTSRDNQEEKNPFKRITHRVYKEQKQYYKIAVPKKFLSNGYYITLGNHDIKSQKKGRIDRLIAKDTWIAHFPIRSVEQYISKILLGWLSVIIKGKESKNKNTARHWKQHFDQILERPKLHYQDLEYLCASYLNINLENQQLIFDPLPSKFLTFTLNGPEPLQQSPYANALHFAETIAHSYSELLSDVKSNKRKGFKLGKIKINIEWISEKT